MANVLIAAANYWRRLMMRNTAFADRYGKLKMLYCLNDPWQMSSAKEQARFVETNARLAGIASRYGSVLELGSGEGHQTVHLQKLADQVYGIELSAQAVERARRRCPSAKFECATMEEAHSLFPEVAFDLVTACEVLCYSSDVDTILKQLQRRSARIFVSNWLPHAENMRQHFAGDGWRRLAPVTYNDTVWECFIWERSRVLRNTSGFPFHATG